MSRTSAYDPFALLDLPRRLNLDAATIERHYADAKSAGGQEEALDHARRTLLDPESRADALLMLLGGPTAETVADVQPTLGKLIAGLKMKQAEVAGDPARLAELKREIEYERRKRLS